MVDSLVSVVIPTNARASFGRTTDLRVADGLGSRYRGAKRRPDRGAGKLEAA
jgi:hypothetical protein